MSHNEDVSHDEALNSVTLGREGGGDTPMGLRSCPGIHDAQQAYFFVFNIYRDCCDLGSQKSW